MPRPLRSAYNPWHALTSASHYASCGAEWYYTEPLPATFTEENDMRVAGSDYGCPDDSIDLLAVSAGLVNLSTLCRACASDSRIYLL